MIKITVHEGGQTDALKEFENEQWPIADREHFGDEMPDFTKKKYIIVAKEEDRIVGFIKMETDMGVAKINSLLVHADFQGKGVGSALIQEAEAQTTQNECHTIILETGEDWHARKFYEKQGYTVITNLKKYYGKGILYSWRKGLKHHNGE